MFKTKSSNVTLLVLLAITSLSFIVDLEYKDVARGKLKILIPKSFVFRTEKVEDNFNLGATKIAEIYSNKDSSVEISFFSVSKDDDFAKMRAMGKMMSPIMSLDAKNAFKENFNDTTTINGYKIYLFDFQGELFGKKPGRIKMFLINAKDSAIAGTINYDLKQNDKWLPITEKILHSIKLN